MCTFLLLSRRSTETKLLQSIHHTFNVPGTKIEQQRLMSINYIMEGKMKKVKNRIICNQKIIRESLHPATT